MACSIADYDYLRRLVLAESANVIGPSRNAMFDSRLAPLARLWGSSSLEAFVEVLRQQPQGNLHRLVAESMTINETSFFRDLKPFDVLRSEILPRIIEQRRGKRTLRIWSAACSTGQEAYSVAMLLREQFPELANWDVRVTGTDLCAPMVKYAQRARYRRMEVNRGLPARLLVKYFARCGEEWEVLPEIRGMCEFRQMNLCALSPPLATFDLILLRNVLIYFSQQDRGSLLGEIDRLLAEDGALVLGHAEQTEDVSDRFEAIFSGETYYYRKSRKIEQGGISIASGR